MKTITLQDPIAMIPDGASPMIGGFMAVGSSERLIDELVQQGKRNLTVIANESSGDGDRAFSSGIGDISTVLPARFQGAAEGLAGVTNNWTELKLPPLPSWVSGVPWVGPIINERWTAAASNSRELLIVVKPYVGPALQWLAAKGGSLGLAILEMLLSIILREYSSPQQRARRRPLTRSQTD